MYRTGTMSSTTRIVGALVLVAVVVVTSSIMTVNNLVLIPVQSELNPLSKWILFFSYNPSYPLFTSLTPAIVNAVVWDFRSIDTFFETTVLFASVIGSITIYYEYFYEKPSRGRGLSLIVKTVVKISMFIAIGLGLAIALKGHITPAGGFQGGAVAVAIIYIISMTYSLYWLYTRGIKQTSMLVLRTSGLLGLTAIAFSPVLLGLVMGYNAYILQNQPKMGAPVGYSYDAGGYSVSLAILLLNIFEFFTVLAAFTLLLMILGIAGRKEVFIG
ncbi:TPA: sodium:proton antiporter [Candidatus Micrarchaeota archaeon]|nr:sodium:proton antiporter [Candidatus Micrarchaeota archaeon]